LRSGAGRLPPFGVVSRRFGTADAIRWTARLRKDLDLGEEFVGDTYSPLLGHGQRLQHIGDVGAPGVAWATVRTTDFRNGRANQQAGVY
jgi:hypothetical protein